MSKKQKPSTKSAGARPPRTKPTAGAAPTLNKKAAARAAGDAARAAGVVDDFARNRPTASKSTASKSTASKSTASKSTASKSTASKSTASKSTASKPTASKSTAARPPHAARPPRPELLEVSIARLDDEGLGIGRHEGKEVVVPGAFPGETVRATVVGAGQRRIFAELRQVLRPHPERIAPPCPCAGDCQGCPLIALAYPAQLRFKEEKVRAALARHPALHGLVVQPVWGAPDPLGYRTNVKLAISRVRGQIRIGLYRRGSHEVVDIGACPLHHPLINRVVAVVRAEATRQELHSYDPVKGRGLLRYLAVRVSPEYDRAMATLVVAERDFRQLPPLAKWLTRKCPEIVSVQQNVNPSTGNVVFGRETLRLLGAADLFDRVGEVRLRLSPTSFFQVNHRQAARLYALVRQWAALTPDETALDLYCGIGGIALHLALDAGRVLGIEVSEEAVRNARDNARLNGRGNCAFHAGDAAELLDDLAGQIAPGAVAVLNPPRGGCDPALLKRLAQLRPRRIVYVSCNPDTLARDLARLHDCGYATGAVQPVDMFPQTGHVETVARLEPLAPPRPHRRVPA